jgi:hypothetical protein
MGLRNWNQNLNEPRAELAQFLPIFYSMDEHQGKVNGIELWFSRSVALFRKSFIFLAIPHDLLDIVFA